MHKDSFILDGKVFILDMDDNKNSSITIREYENNTKRVLELENLIEEIRHLIDKKAKELLNKAMINDASMDTLQIEVENLRSLLDSKKVELEKSHQWTKDLSSIKTKIPLKTEKERLEDIESLLIEEKIRRSILEEERTLVRKIMK